LPADPGTPPAARASDRDRENALEQLSTAAGDGRLTLEEYSARADRALAARVLSEVAAVTADLVQAPKAAAEAPQQLTAILSSDSRTGYWRVPSHVAARSLLGECLIDLQDAVLTSHVTLIEAKATLGSVTILVPDGADVQLSGKAILGEKTSEVRQAPLPGAPILDVRATAILGSVTVRPRSLAKRIVGALSGTPAARLPSGEDG
jgi:hypothetical protein